MARSSQPCLVGGVVSLDHGVWLAARKSGNYSPAIRGVSGTRRCHTSPGRTPAAIAKHRVGLFPRGRLVVDSDGWGFALQLIGRDWIVDGRFGLDGGGLALQAIRRGWSGDGCAHI